MPCLYIRNKNEDLKRIKVETQTKPNICLCYVIFYYICGVEDYATSQVADLPRPDRRDIDMVSIALKFSGIENDI